MTVLGHWVVILALLASIGAALGFLRAASTTGARLARPRLLMLISTMLVVCASALLVFLLLRNDFSNGYVYGYSDRSLPLHFLISSFYAGQEGSFLFWALCSALIAPLLALHTRSRGGESGVMTVYLFVQSLLLLIVVAKSPFRSVWEVWPQFPIGQVPIDGRGLNPLLQNFWMVIHPPVLFLGFAAMAAPFSLAIAGLWKNRADYLHQMGLPWLLLAVTVLGLGIMLGAYWAYGVLGWGGYWGWDPVENSSLLPWLTGVALVHTVLVERRTGKYTRTNFALAVVTFFLVIYSTFLTRSGILGDASVHAFTDPGSAVYWLLIAFLALIVFTGVLFLIVRWKSLKPVTDTGGWLTREMLLAGGAIALLLSALVTLFGTSLPIVSKTRVEPSFYDAMNLPLVIVMALFIGISLCTQWEEQDVRATVRRSLRAIAAAFIIVCILVFAGMHDPATSILVFTSLFALLVNLDFLRLNLRGGVLLLGGKLAHIGLALFLLGVVSTGKYARTERVALPRQAPVQVLGQTLTYDGFTIAPDKKYEFHVRSEGSAGSFTLSPVMFETGTQGILRNPDIASAMFADFYLSPMSLEPAQEGGAVEELTLTKGTMSPVHGVQVTFVRFDMGPHGSGDMTGGSGEMQIGAVLDLTKGTERETLMPRMRIAADGSRLHDPVPSRLLEGQVSLLSMNAGEPPGNSSVVVGMTAEGGGVSRPEILMVEASVKPLINLLWGGTLLMMIGFVLSIVKRWKEKA